MTVIAKHRNINRTQFVPKLRFPDYSKKWLEYTYDDIFTFKKTNSFSRDKLNYKIGTVKNIHYGDIHTKFKTGFNINQEYVPFVNPEVDLSKIREEDYCSEMDLIVADASEDYDDVGKTIEIIELGDKKLVSGLHTYIARPNKELIVKGFGGYLVQSRTIRKQVKILCQGTKVHGISSKQLAQVLFKMPSLPEQKKIADFLTTVDKKIQALEKKKALLEQYKKGVMQKIFSQEIRFKPDLSEVEGKDDGSDYKDWEEVLFEDLYEFAKSNSLSREKLNYSLGDVYNVHYGDIHTKFRSSFNIENENVPFVNLGIDLSNYKKKDYLENGDLIIADASEDYNDIGKTIEVVSVGDFKVLAGLHTFLAKLNSDKVSIGFISKYIKSWDYRYQVMRIAQGTKVLSLSKGRVAKLKIKLPIIEEQDKIANFLTSLDEKINGVSNQIEKMKLWKKGLLQQMFV
jgi:type I restriction enzyme S subunit